MTSVRALPIAGEQFTSDDTIEVKSPYDGRVLGAVPACTAAEVDVAVTAARRAIAAPLPLWKRAEILDTAARLLKER
ncbi:MAG TPA: aldehyde dehydrogenase family protein, partial [Ilumatobacteraceae bacterium]